MILLSSLKVRASTKPTIKAVKLLMGHPDYIVDPLDTFEEKLQKRSTTNFWKMILYRPLFCDWKNINVRNLSRRGRNLKSIFEYCYFSLCLARELFEQ